MRETIAIIGAGVAGLAVGCYALMNGYRPRIFEMNPRPGGLCTAWQRDGYTVDACVRWLAGTSPRSRFHRLWEELGVLPGREIFDHDVFTRVEGADGRAVTFYTDIDRLADHLLEVAPEDRDILREWIRGLRRLTHFDLPVDRPPELAGPGGRLGMTLRSLPRLGVSRRWSGMTVRQFSDDLDNPWLREAFPLAFGLPERSMIAVMMSLAAMHNRASGYPVGGSLPLTNSIERRYLELGGTVEYGARVVEILVEQNRAVGVRLANGSEHRTDLVVSAADGHATIFELLGGRYCDDTVRGYYEHLPTFPPLLLAGIGIRGSIEGLPDTAAGVNFPLPEPIPFDRRQLTRLSVHASTFDPTLAPSGATILKLMIPSSFERWRKLRETPADYQAEKRAIASELVRGLDQRFPRISRRVEMIDIATPITWHRYTGNWEGSSEGWLPSPASLTLHLRKTLPGLYDFCMAGQWVQPGGGLPSAALSARHVVQSICQRDNKSFRTSLPGGAGS